MPQGQGKAEQVAFIARQLEQSKNVTQLDAEDHKEAWVLAIAFLDLAESFEQFTHGHLAKLKQGGLDAREVEDLLTEIGVEFQHILWHLRSNRFYTYLQNT